MPENFVTSLSRGLEVLQAFTGDYPEMTLTEVASRIGLNAASTRRSLLTLEDLGYITHHGRRFLLTPKVLRLSEAFLSSMAVLEVVQQYLQEVSDATGDTTSLGVLDGKDIIYIATVPVRRAFHTTPTTGTRYPSYCSSMGRMILAHSDEETITYALSPEPLRRFTENTITSTKEIRKILREAKATGITGIQEEVSYGVVSAAVPIEAPDGRVIASINCSTAAERASAADLIATRRDPLNRGRSQIQSALKRHPALVHSIEGARAGFVAQPAT